MNEVVKYHNDLNTVTMRGWSATEMNIFFGIIAKLRDEGTKEIILDTDDLREITDTIGSKVNSARWGDAVEALADKIISLKYYYRDEKKRTVMNLFSFFEVNVEKKVLKVAVTDYFDYIINQLTVEFTTWELLEFRGLKSSYTKTIYRLLKQWRTVGKATYTVAELRTLLEIPESYSTGMVKKRVIEQSVKELSSYFKGIKCKSVKSNRQGTPVIAYEFTWQAENTGKWIENKYKKKYNEPLPSWMNVDGTVKQTARPENVSSQAEEEIRERLNKLLGDW